MDDDGFDYDGFIGYMLDEQTTQSQILYGNRDDLSEPELEIVFDRRLTLTDKLTRLTSVRGQSVKPRTFKKWLNPEDSIRARAFGIKL